MSSGCKRAIVALALVACRRPPAPDFEEVRALVDRHCLSCHAEHNTSTVFPFAPEGVLFDRPDELRRHAARIRQRVVVDRNMPLLNKTEMTDAERDLIDRWVRAGARVPSP